MPNLRFSLGGAAVAITLSGAAMADVSASTLETAGSLNLNIMKAAASVCMIEAGVAVDSEIEALAKARMTFLNAVEVLGAEDIPGGTAALMEAWWPVDGAISLILAGDTPEGYAATVAEQRAPLQFAALAVQDQANYQYQAATDASISEILMVDVAERQSVLVQEMKLIACELAKEPSSEGAVALLDTMNVFEASMTALDQGIPEMGILPSEDYAVKQALAASSFDWDVLKSALTTIADNGTASVEDLEGLRWKTNAVNTRMTAVVATYLAPANADGTPRVAQLENDAD